MDFLDTFLFRDRYRIPSIRLRNRNYALPGMYYVTICTKGRVPWFGKIRDGRMGLSAIGRIVTRSWWNIPHRHPHVSLDAFVVMPDHVHGIIRIHEIANRESANVETPLQRNDVSTTRDRIMAIMNRHPMHKPQWKPGCLGAIIQGFKSSCVKHIRTTHPDFSWQPRFYEHIIRNKEDLERIRWYIRTNPERYKKFDDL